MNWQLMFLILGGVAGGALYVWLAAWGALRLGAHVQDATGSEGLGFGAYWVAIFLAFALPFAVGAGISG